jgi:N-acetylneuraminic acid mutarotase
MQTYQAWAVLWQQCLHRRPRGWGWMNAMEWVGQTIGNYRIEALLDAGGMGQVFRGMHVYLHRGAAIKLMHANLAANPDFRARFLQEAKSAAALNHPNIVKIYEFGEQEGHFYLAMELVTGGSLAALMQRQGSGRSLPLRQLELLCQAADGLAAAHAQGVIHRDIKPGNLLLSRVSDAGATAEEYILKISDFGLARLIEGDRLTHSGVMLGTPAYMSPEQCRGEKLDGRSDLYSLGVVLYEAATGHLPFPVETPIEAVYKHVNVAPPMPRQVCPDLPIAIETIILQCLAKQPEDRYPTGTELARALRAALAVPFLQPFLVSAPADGAADENTRCAVFRQPVPFAGNGALQTTAAQLGDVPVSQMVVDGKPGSGGEGDSGPQASIWNPSRGMLAADAGGEENPGPQGPGHGAIFTLFTGARQRRTGISLAYIAGIVFSLGLVVILALYATGRIPGVDPPWYRPVTITIAARRSAPRWVSVAAMPTPRYGMAVVAGRDGRIYALGGYDGAYLATVEAYTPATNTWTTLAPMPVASGGLAAAVVPSGRIYAIGGANSGGPLATVQVYTPATNTWTLAAAMPTPRYRLAAVTGPDGRIYAIGGQNGTFLDTVEAYNPATNTWATMAPMRTPREGLTAVTGSDGRMYAIGGSSQKGIILNTVEAYTLATNIWTPVASMFMPRYRSAAVAGPGGRIYVMGGADVDNGYLNTVEAYTPGTNSWMPLAPLLTARESLAAATGSSGRIYAVGGTNGVNRYLATVEVYEQ